MILLVHAGQYCSQTNVPDTRHHLSCSFVSSTGLVPSALKGLRAGEKLNFSQGECSSNISPLNETVTHLLSSMFSPRVGKWFCQHAASWNFSPSIHTLAFSVFSTRRNFTTPLTHSAPSAASKWLCVLSTF